MSWLTTSTQFLHSGTTATLELAHYCILSHVKIHFTSNTVFMCAFRKFRTIERNNARMLI
jgi:hypothetical protein